MANSKQDIRSLRLDPSIFKQALYTDLLKTYLSTYPNPSSVPGPADLKRWFGLGATPEEKTAFDETCRRISALALTSLGPELVSLPPFDSHDADRELYPVFAAPFLPEFLDEKAKPDAGQRAEAALALSLLLDQMPRNCFRDESQRVVYEHYDRISRALSHAICEAHVDWAERWGNVAAAWRMWFYMCLIHSEDIRDHEELTVKRRAEMEVAKKDGAEATVKFLEMQMSNTTHEDALRQFGRYPWRNKWLGRENTKEEQEFLDNGGGPFQKPKEKD